MGDVHVIYNHNHIRNFCRHFIYNIYHICNVCHRRHHHHHHCTHPPTPGIRDLPEKACVYVFDRSVYIGCQDDYDWMVRSSPLLELTSVMHLHAAEDLPLSDTPPPSYPTFTTATSGGRGYDALQQHHIGTRSL